MNNQITALISISILSAFSLHGFANESPMGISLITGLEAYEDSPSSSLSKGHGLSFLWDDLHYDQPYQPNKAYISGRGTYIYESDAEKYDDDRYRHSGDFAVSYQRSFTEWGKKNEYLISFLGRAEGHYNCQQLEEFELQTTAGVAINRRFDGVNPYDLGLIFGLAYNRRRKR